MKRYIAIILCCFLSSWSFANGEHREYTTDRPLIIVCDWDFRPFEFMGLDGEPSGYNVELLGRIFDRRRIPHKFVMQEWKDAVATFEDGKADVIHALAHVYQDSPYISTKKYVNYYTLRAVRRLDTPKLERLEDLDSTVTIALKENDYTALELQQRQDLKCRISYRLPKDALTGVRAGTIPYFIWGEVPLQRKVKELAIDSVAFDEIDLQPGELRLISSDKNIIDVIDDEYTRMELEGEVQRISDKWFHPDRVHSDHSAVFMVVFLVLAVVVIIVLLLAWLMRSRVKAAVRRNTDLKAMMEQALKMREFFVLEYDIQSGMVRNRYNHLLPDEGISDEELIERIHPDEREDFRKHVEGMKRGEFDEWYQRKRWNDSPVGEPPHYREFDGSAILERANGKPRYMFHAFTEITQEVEEEARNKQMAETYKKVFDTNLAAMSFYDANGHLLDLNEQMRQLCEFDEERERFFREGNLFDDPFTRDFVEQGSRDTYHVCGHLCYPEVGIDKYIETRIRPIYDDNDHLVFFIIASRDVTAERDMYMKQREHDRQIQETNEAINRYEQQLNYLLEESKMYVWKYNIQKQRIYFSRTLRMSEYDESLEEYLEGMAPSHREEALTNLREAVLKGIPFHSIHEFLHTKVSQEPSWYSISGIPLQQENGRVEEYFGIVREITDLMTAQEKLRQETARAEDSGLLKSAFLANMTHEIRTPLNAIVGFSDLLQSIDSTDERMEFIRIIHNNCDMLLRLINDILEASNMGQSIAIKPEPIELPKVFDEICQTLEQRVQGTGVTFLKDNPYLTYPAVLDKGRLQQVLTNFVTNAIKYTQQGHIRVGYREEIRRQGGQDIVGLYFYCEDTGAGIPKEKQDAVFERFVKLNDFVQGTGLGLSICKAIVDKCHGQIGVTSEGEGHGSTFWFWVPREIQESKEA